MQVTNNNNNKAYSFKKIINRIFRIFRSTVFVINLFFILIFLLSSFSYKVNPNDWMIFAYLGLGFPVIFVINLLFAGWWLITHRWKYLLVCGIAFMLCAGAIFTYFPVHRKTDTIPEGSIKVLTYNVMKFGNFKDHTREHPNQIIQYIINSKADIVCIQEYGESNKKGLIKKEQIENALHPVYPYQKVVRFLSGTNKETCYGGLAVYSKFPITSSEQIPLESQYNGSMIAEIDIHGKKVSLINNHLESNKLSMEERNQYTSAIKNFDSGTFEYVKDKLSNRLAPAYELRAYQADTIASIINHIENPYIIVCGDFNDTPISYTRYKVKGKMKDAFSDTGFGPGISYNQNRFWFRIDYILHSRNIKAYNCTVDRVKYSDHYPVWTYLKLE